MIDWQKYGPSYTVSPGIKKIGDLPIIEFDDQEDRYLELKKKTKLDYRLQMFINQYRVCKSF